MCLHRLALAVSLLLAACTRSDPTTSPPPPPPAKPAAAQPPRERSSPAQEGEGPLASPFVRADAVRASQQARPPEPPYDLGADRERRVRKAKEELGAKTTTLVVSDIFVVIGPPGWQGAAFDASVSLMRSAMAGYMNGRFAKKPSRAISVYLFPNGATYETFCKKQYAAPCIAHYGFYSPVDRYMVMNAGLGLGTLTHELVHPLVETDFPGAPTWINEGIASLFEGPVLPRPGEIHGVKNWRHPRLAQALRGAEKDRARLDKLFGMPDETFRGEGEDLHYAMGRYACQWLDERGKLWPFYQRWRDNFAEDPTGERSFKDVIGTDPRAAHAAWAKWVLAL